MTFPVQGNEETQTQTIEELGVSPGKAIHRIGEAKNPGPEITAFEEKM